MHAWVSTDSLYVKKRITEWLPGWTRNNWRNSNGAAVANKTLWQALLGMVGRMRKIKWSWVKAQSGILLNECADILRTKGVANEQPPALVQYLVPMGEDTDCTEYEIREGEAALQDVWRGDERPERTYVMKDGDNLADYLASDPTSDEPDSGAASATVSAMVSAVVSAVVSNDASELEESNTKPAPVDDSDDDAPRCPITFRGSMFDGPQGPRGLRVGSAVVFRWLHPPSVTDGVQG
jgi:hypothetical protein